MKKKLIIFKTHNFLTLLFCLIACYTSTMAIKPEVNYAIFSTADKGSYVESYILVPGSSAVFGPNRAGRYQAQIEIISVFSKGDTVVKADKYILQSQEILDTLGLGINMLDQKRILLPDGSYEWEIKFTDLNAPLQKATFRQVIDIKTPTNLTISDITLIERYEKTTIENEYSKNGYNLIPNAINYYPAEFDKLIFYAELYHADKFFGNKTGYLASFYLTLHNKKEVLNNARQFKRLIASPLEVLFAEFDISRLYSGNYDLVIELRNNKNEFVQEKRIFFQRNKTNPEADNTSSPDLSSISVANTFAGKLTDEEVVFYLKSNLPRLDDSQQRYVRNMIAGKDLDIMRRYTYYYWSKQNPIDAASEFNAFKLVADAVENSYKTSQKHGFETERGRVFLQYGKPSDMVVSMNEPGALPYEVWQYYKVNNGQTNVRFIFYQPNLGDMEYILIHSDVFGEVNDPRWQMRVFKNFQSLDLDKEQIRDHQGSRIREADDYFKRVND